MTVCVVIPANPGSGSRAGPVKYKAEQDFTGQASSFRRRPESSVAARIAEEDKHRVKDKGYLLPKQSHSTAEGAEDTEETNNREKTKPSYPH